VKERVTREGPVGVEIVRRRDGKVTLNVFNNGLQSFSARLEYDDITMPEALVWLAAQLRMGAIKL
jgi:hypothetical protein